MTPREEAEEIRRFIKNFSETQERHGRSPFNEFMCGELEMVLRIFVTKAIKGARKEGREEEIKRRKPFAMLANTPNDASIMVENHKDEINCPYCKHKVYVMYAPSSYDDFKLGREMVPHAFNLGLKKAKEILNKRMDVWDKAQTDYHHTKYCAGLDLLDLIQEEIDNGNNM